jgi:pyruvate dehydrogenase E2 component (dihydrolipoamide acetyltransferase)
MAYVLILPRQGNTVESCIIVDWKVKEGDEVAADTTVCEVETDKATFELPAGEAGRVLKILRPVGDDVPVLDPLAVIGQAGEDWEAALQNAGAAPGLPSGQKPVQAELIQPEPGQGAAPGTGPGAPILSEGGAVSPRARNLAGREGLPLTRDAGIAGSGPGGRIIERDVIGALESRPALTAAARAVLDAGGTLPEWGSGLGGRVRAADILGGTAAVGAPGKDIAGTAAAGLDAQGSAQGSGTASPPSIRGVSPASLGEGAVTETPIRGIRKLIADRMFQSLAESAQFTLNGSAPAARLRALRERMKNSGSPASGGSLDLSQVTINDLILFAVSRVLPQYPFMNAHKTGDVLKTFERVHLGVAVDTPRGLMVPVIRNANLLPLLQISAEAKRLAGACQKGNIDPGELSGSTFTVTNLGSLGITGFTPVLNFPEVAILGVCGIELKPVIREGEGVGYEPHIGFSLTINHQVVDGAPAARFLKALGEAVADIDLLLAYSA